MPELLVEANISKFQFPETNSVRFGSPIGVTNDCINNGVPEIILAIICV